MAFSRGEIVLAYLGSPSETGAQAYTRPAIIVVDQPLIDRCSIVPLTKESWVAKNSCVVGIAPDPGNKLWEYSYALVHHVMPARRGILKPLGGNLSPIDFDRVFSSLRDYMSL